MPQTVSISSGWCGSASIFVRNRRTCTVTVDAPPLVYPQTSGQQPLAGQCFAGMTHEAGEQVEFHRGKDGRCTSNLGSPCPRVQSHRPDQQRRAAGPGSAAMSPPPNGNHTGRQFLWSVGSGQAVVSPGEQKLHPGGGVADGNCDQRSARAADQADQGGPGIGVNSGVDDGDIRLETAQHRAQRVDAADGRDTEAVPLERRRVEASSRAVRRGKDDEQVVVHPSEHRHDVDASVIGEPGTSHPRGNAPCDVTSPAAWARNMSARFHPLHSDDPVSSISGPPAIFQR